jgi:hypothetical protein
VHRYAQDKGCLLQIVSFFKIPSNLSASFVPFVVLIFFTTACPDLRELVPVYRKRDTKPSTKGHKGKNQYFYRKAFTPEGWHVYRKNIPPPILPAGRCNGFPVCMALVVVYLQIAFLHYIYSI